MYRPSDEELMQRAKDYKVPGRGRDPHMVFSGLLDQFETSPFEALARAKIMKLDNLDAIKKEARFYDGNLKKPSKEKGAFEDEYEKVAVILEVVIKFDEIGKPEDWVVPQGQTFNDFYQQQSKRIEAIKKLTQKFLTAEQAKHEVSRSPFLIKGYQSCLKEIEKLERDAFAYAALMAPYKSYEAEMTKNKKPKGAKESTWSLTSFSSKKPAPVTPKGSKDHEFLGIIYDRILERTAPAGTKEAQEFQNDSRDIMLGALWILRQDLSEKSKKDRNVSLIEKIDSAIQSIRHTNDLEAWKIYPKSLSDVENLPVPVEAIRKCRDEMEAMNKADHTVWKDLELAGHSYDRLLKVAEKLAPEEPTRTRPRSLGITRTGSE